MKYVGYIFRHRTLVRLLTLLFFLSPLLPLPLPSAAALSSPRSYLEEPHEGRVESPVPEDLRNEQVRRAKQLVHSQRLRGTRTFNLGLHTHACACVHTQISRRAHEKKEIEVTKKRVGG